jgi:hypothetical protein
VFVFFVYLFFSESRCVAITDSGVEALATGVPTLCTLDLSHLNRLTDKGVIALAKYLPSIETILLQNCEKVTEAAVSHIEQNKTIKSTVLPIQSQLLIKVRLKQKKRFVIEFECSSNSDIFLFSNTHILVFVMCFPSFRLI